MYWRIRTDGKRFRPSRRTHAVASLDPDDEPVTLKTTHRPIVALPYNFEQHDIVMMALQHHTSDVMYRRSMDAFEWLYSLAHFGMKFGLDNMRAIVEHSTVTAVSSHQPPPARRLRPGRRRGWRMGRR